MARMPRVVPTSAAGRHRAGMKPVPQRQPGTLKGKLEVPSAFFEPLPEAELRRWEGG